jgi:hypothetical protein
VLFHKLRFELTVEGQHRILPTPCEIRSPGGA